MNPGVVERYAAAQLLLPTPVDSNSPSFTKQFDVSEFVFVSYLFSELAGALLASWLV